MARSYGAGLYVLFGGTTTDTTVRAGGADVVQAGATASGTMLSGGAEVVSTATTTRGNDFYPMQTAADAQQGVRNGPSTTGDD